MAIKISTNESWCISGDNKKGLEEALQAIADVTKVSIINASDLSLWRLAQETHVVDGRRLEEGYYYPCIDKKSRAKKSPEVASTTLFEWGKGLFDLSSRSIFSLGKRIGLEGEALSICPWERDEYLQKILEVKGKQKLTLITRGHKVFGVFSGTYAYIPQTNIMMFLEEGEKELGESEIRFWMDHDHTRVWVRFTEKAEELSKTYKLPKIMVPGIWISTSDTSEGSIRIEETWDDDRGHFVYGKDVSRKHSGKVELDKLRTEMNRKIFAEFTYVPQRLAELLEIDIKSVDSFGILKKLGADKILGSKRTDELALQIDAELNSVPHLTAYGVVIRMLTIPERVSGFSELQTKLLKECLFGLFDYEFEKSTKIILM